MWNKDSTLDLVQIKNPVLLCYLFIHGWFQLNQQADLWLIAPGLVCVCVHCLHALVYVYVRDLEYGCVRMYNIKYVPIFACIFIAGSD